MLVLKKQYQTSHWRSFTHKISKSLSSLHWSAHTFKMRYPASLEFYVHLLRINVYCCKNNNMTGIILQSQKLFSLHLLNIHDNENIFKHIIAYRYEIQILVYSLREYFGRWTIVEKIVKIKLDVHA